MRIRDILILIIILFIYFSVVIAYSEDGSKPIHWRPHSQEVYLEADNLNRSLFILVSSEWCHVCEQYKQEILYSEEVSTFINDLFIPVLLDFDKDKDLAREYAWATPTTVIETPDGQIVDSKPGYISTEELLSILEQSLDFSESENRVEKEHIGDILPKHNRMEFTGTTLYALPIKGGDNLKAKEKKIFSRSLLIGATIILTAIVLKRKRY